MFFFLNVRMIDSILEIVISGGQFYPFISIPETSNSGLIAWVFEAVPFISNDRSKVSQVYARVITVHI